MKQFLPLSIVLCFLTMQTQTFAQSLDHVLGEYLVKVNPNHDIQRIALDHQTFEGTPTRLRAVKALKTPWNIWKVSFDHNAVHEGRFLDALKSNPGVAVAQMNHIAERRATFPDDPSFNEQWQWFNTGINGALEDADVDAELAWDITTGGVTPDGDDIVVAVLDDGTDLSHPDLMANHWVNTLEIENNGIDDDGNGYIDDYDGWNLNSNSDDVSGGNHGVRVEGMIGGVGNNGIGGTGINWDVKIMTIRYSGVQEAQVLESYAYPYEMRKRYNETDGAEGAFVVATNASWGIDFGDPVDAPLWCGFYDDLGAEGVLNCGATSNQNLDIDVEGDLPTACPSDFMVSVTRTNSGNAQAGGYGPIAIDLGAPGDDVYTTTAGGGYGFTSGTSFSSPLVAGIIALMYSAPCNTLISLAKSDPQAAALAVRGYLLDNVTPVDGYETLVATGGIANAHLAIQGILDNCGPCPPPSGLNATNVTDVMADLVWGNGPNATQANLRWRAVGAAAWTDVADATSPLMLTGLMACTEYEFQVMNECADSMAVSDFSLEKIFKTDGCCEAPSEVIVTDVTDATASASWNSILAAVSYNVQYRRVGTADWTIVNTTETSLAITDLMTCSDYELQVQTVCNGDITDYGESVNFFVLGCEDCAESPYCEQEGSTQFEFVNSMTLNGFTNISGNDGGYLLMGTPVLLLDPLIENFITVTLGFEGGAFAENVAVWIDFNQDYVFTEDEIVLQGESNEFVTGNFIIPAGASPGISRMRVKAFFGGANADPCATGYEGEVEDYCVLINDGTFECSIPQNLNVSLAGSVPTLTFDASTGADEYLVEYSPAGMNMWTSFITSETTFELPAIADCGSFDVQVSAFCSDVISGASSPFVFEIPCPCTAPNSIDTLNTDFDNMTVAWPGNPDAIGYEVLWKKSSDTDWFSDATSTNSFFASPLSECTDYDFQVKAVCQNDESGFTDIFTFTTRCLPSSTNQSATWANSLSAQPNPFTQTIQLNVALEDSHTFDFFLRDVNGKMIRASQNHQLKAGANSISLDGLDGLPQGVYFVQATSNEETGLIKLIKL